MIGLRVVRRISRAQRYVIGLRVVRRISRAQPQEDHRALAHSSSHDPSCQPVLIQAALKKCSDHNDKCALFERMTVCFRTKED